jgi:hypothetical protein
MRKKPLSLITDNRKPTILRGKILATHSSDVVMIIPSISLLSLIGEGRIITGG